jgi:hypothetical protein
MRIVAAFSSGSPLPSQYCAAVPFLRHPQLLNELLLLLLPSFRRYILALQIRTK